MVQLLRLRGYGGGVWRRISKNALTGLNLLELCKLCRLDDNLVIAFVSYKMCFRDS